VANKTKTLATKKSSTTVSKPLPVARASRRPSSQVHPARALLRTMTAPAQMISPADILALQRVAGNRAVEQLLAERMQHEQPSRLTIQAKLAVGAADDLYEREADRVAAQVLQTSEPTSAPSVSPIQRQPSQPDEEMMQAKPLVSSITPLLQRQEMPEKDEDETHIQRRVDGGPTSVEPNLERGIDQARARGQLLPDDFRARMERAFGADFSRVRVHADSQSDSLNRALQAKAFTTGQDMFFKSGEYNPASRRGQELIAHELTHVVQQSGGRSGKPGLSVQRAPSNVIQRSVADAIRRDRLYWKMLPTNVKIPMMAAAPILGPLVQMWQSGVSATSTVYNRLAGNDPSALRAILSGLLSIPGAFVGAAYGAAEGFLRGLTFGIGNPLYSVGKRLVKGVQAIPEAVSEARGIYDADPTGKYGNLPGNRRRENYKVDTKYDLANYLLLATSAGSAVGGFGTKNLDILISGQNPFTDNVSMLSKTGEALSWMGGISSVAGAATSLVDAKRGYAEWRETASTKGQQRLGAGKALSGVASATQQSASAAFHFGNLAKTGVAATAQTVTGGAALATGAVDIVRGSYGIWRANQNIARLTSLQERESLQGPQGRDIKKAAQQGVSTQEIRKSVAKGTIAKGVLTVAGGALLAFTSVTPVGWALLGAGALIGGIYAIKRFFDKRKRKEEVAMRELKVTKTEREYWEKDVDNIKKKTWWGSDDRKAQLKRLGPDPLQVKLEQFGFKSVGHFYANYINYMANHLYDKGVDGKVDLVRKVMQKITLKEVRGIPMINPGLVDDVIQLPYKKVKPYLDIEGITVDMQGNHYPEVEEVIKGIGLQFDWRKDPPQPTPDKIGKALDE
jgi:hypothetical protein